MFLSVAPMPETAVQIVTDLPETAPPSRPDLRIIATVPWWILAHPDLKPMAKLVATAIGGHMNGRLECCPSRDTIAAIIGVDVKTVTRAVMELERAGVMEVTRRSSGKVKESNRYRWRNPKTGETLAVKVPAQMEAALMTLHRGTPESRARDKSRGKAGDTRVPQTPASSSNKRRGIRYRGTENSGADPKPQRGGEFEQASKLWRQSLRGLGAAPDQLELGES